MRKLSSIIDSSGRHNLYGGRLAHLRKSIATYAKSEPFSSKVGAPGAFTLTCGAVQNRAFLLDDIQLHSFRSVNTVQQKLQAMIPASVWDEHLAILSVADSQQLG
ncbi:hypothetical protein CC2G_010867 [Coprinopsis cinerea AmutBmut pab1-1]|nr:hypothetical protein CC2G_010867 [Coprinopsis cinerea AmutBmut pab1-1]